MSQGNDTTGVVPGYIKVASGKYISIDNPTDDGIELLTIAAALSKICRFGGHCPTFYSVAEHCCLAASLAIAEGCSRDCAKAILLHDAAEAYIGDMVKPMKVKDAYFSDLERKFETVIARKFRIRFDLWEDSIRRFDLMMLKTEKEFFWPDDNTEWLGLSRVASANIQLACLSPKEAELWFNCWISHIWFEMA